MYIATIHTTPGMVAIEGDIRLVSTLVDEVSIPAIRDAIREHLGTIPYTLRPVTGEGATKAAFVTWKREDGDEFRIDWVVDIFPA